ncbi:MAG: hypothetical protein GSR80_001171 [Desulfurococcales archaeon]|nr:hypothetical protein [Desulfurococcales archaeon]
MSRARVIASLALALLMIAAPLMALYHAPTAAALQPNTTIKVYPYKIVKGQDVLFTVVQTGGAFTPGATLYVKVKNQDSWGTGDGYAWIGLPSGQYKIPKGSYFYLPANYYDTDLEGSNNLNTGSAYFLVSDSSDGSSGVTGAQITVESGSVPYISVGVPPTSAASYMPSDILAISYTTNSLPEFTVNAKPFEYSPGSVVTLYYYVPGNTVYFYWDYYGGQLLATAKGGVGEVHIKVPDAPEGFHFIVAVSDTGYGAFNVIYVKPELIASHFSIAGVANETVTFTGRGFPANAELDTTQYVTLTVYDGVNTGTMRAQIISGGTADALGRMTLTIRLIDSKPPTVKGGLVDITLYYKSGDIDDVVGGTFQQGQLGPAGDGQDTIENVLAISTPTAYGDEVLIAGYYPGSYFTPGTPEPSSVGNYIFVTVVNFPANTKVGIYVGYKLAGTLVTDSRGAATGYIMVPDLPGVDNSGTQITYTVRALAQDPKTHGTLVGVAANGQDYMITISTDAEAYYAPSGYGAYGDYLASGQHTVTVEIYGLSPFAKVDIYEDITGLGTINILDFADVYQPVVLEGSETPYYFVANADGVLEVKYTVSYLTLFDILGAAYGNTGDNVTVYVDATTASGTPLLTNYKVLTYHMIFPAYGEITQVISSPANITPALDSAGPFQVIHPGDYIEVQFYNLVPGTCYTLTLNGAPVQLYDTTNAPVSCVKADNTGTITARFTVPNSRSVIGFDEVDVVYLSGVLQGQSAGSHLFIASSPREDLYGTAKVFVFPTEASPGDTIYIVGVNFESNENLIGGFSTIGTPQSGTADAHGAVAFSVTVPNLPAGTYTVYIERTVTYETFNAIIQIVPKVVSVSSSSVLTVLYKAAGQTVSLQVVGVEPNRAYMVYWSDNPNVLGEPITSTGVPGVGTPLTWFSDSNGELTVTFTVPFGVIGKAYYATIVPADNPTTAILPPIEVKILPAPYFDVEESPYVIPGQVFSVDFNLTGALADTATGLYKLFPSFYNTSLQQADLTDMINYFVANGRAFAIITMPDGSHDVVPATMQPIGNGMLRISFKVPNAQESGVIGLEIGFALTTVPSIWNTSSQFDYPLYNTAYTQLTVGGLELVPGGGIFLTSVSGQLATVVNTVNSAVQVITTTVQEMKPVIMNISDTVAYINTTLGVMTAKLDEIEGMISDSTAKLVQKGDEIMAEIDSQSGQVLMELDALAKLVNGAYVNLTSGQAEIMTSLGEINMSIGDLATLIHSMGNNVMAEIDAVNASLAKIVVSEGDHVIAELSVLVNQLQPLITSLNGTIATLQTSIGELQANVTQLLAGQATIEKLVVNQSGAVIAVIKTTAGQMNATLASALEMLGEGLANVTSQAMSQLQAISNKIDTASGALSSKLDSVLAAVNNVNSAVSTLGDKLDSLSSAVSTLDSKVGSLSAAVSTVSGKLDTVSKKLGDISTSLSDVSGKVTTIQSNVADVKSTLSDVKSTVSSISSQLSSLSKNVNSLSSKVDKATTESSAAKSRATVLGGTTAGLVIVNIIITALAMARRPE